MSQRPATRLYIPAHLVSGGVVEIDTAQVHRLRNVLRLGQGAFVAAFNAEQGEWLCEIAELARQRGRLTLRERLRAPAEEPGPWLLFAPIKRAPLDWLIEKATELGVAALAPVWTSRTQAERLNRERLLAGAIAAAEQCERLSVPDIHAPRSLAETLAAWPGERRLLVCDETGGGAPIAAALADFAPGTPAALLIGPEGGFAETELDALGKLTIVSRIGLGPRVLRAETAAIAALAAFQAVCGDWRGTRRR